MHQIIISELELSACQKTISRVFQIVPSYKSYECNYARSLRIWCLKSWFWVLFCIFLWKPHTVLTTIEFRSSKTSQDLCQLCNPERDRFCQCELQCCFWSEFSKTLELTVHPERDRFCHRECQRCPHMRGRANDAVPAT